RTSAETPQAKPLSFSDLYAEEGDISASVLFAIACGSTDTLAPEIGGYLIRCRWRRTGRC
ncbi:hypothetical protein PIB30_090967, partial [Stylosanthes scabra]|nr:hypothetical protein [Stylosanthes scabra]